MVIATDRAPEAIGPYSQAVIAGGFVFCSGQIALSPGSPDLVGATAAEQTAQVLKNLGEVLDAAGSSFERVVKSTIYLTNLADFTAVNQVYAGFFAAAPPARATVEVSSLPRGAMVEIDAIATVADEGEQERRVRKDDPGPNPNAP